MKRSKLIDVLLFIYSSVSLYLSAAFFSSIPAYAMGNLVRGFQNLTVNYLLPLTSAVAGAAVLVLGILSYFRPEEYAKKCGGAIAILIITLASKGMINSITSAFT